ncbi:MAG: hypothetical protein NTV51_01595 [Verrucomicrobia bacterium]|nr:hypothetical protein [Verrucomicrobiota bacterium]
MKEPPSYLKNHAKEPVAPGPHELLLDGTWCGHGEPDYAIFEVHDADVTSLGLHLPSGAPFPALCAVTAFRDGGAPFFVYDPRHHPASAFTGSEKDHPWHPAPAHRCFSCGAERFRLAVGFEIPGDSESPDDTSWFALAVQCTACGAREGLFDDETA